MDLNKTMIIGRLTRDPEVKTTPNGATVTSMSLATGYSWKDQSGNKQEKTETGNNPTQADSAGRPLPQAPVDSSDEIKVEDIPF